MSKVRIQMAKIAMTFGKKSWIHALVLSDAYLAWPTNECKSVFHLTSTRLDNENASLDIRDDHVVTKNTNGPLQVVA
jgi:hypothetical protein